MEILILIGAIFIPAYIIQTILGFKQIKVFTKEMSSMRKKGKVAIGRESGIISSGVIVLLLLDESGKIVEGRKLQGTSVFAKFEKFNTLNGLYIVEIPLVVDKLKEFKNVKKALIDAKNNYMLVVNGQKIPEKPSLLSKIGTYFNDKIKLIFN